METFFASSQASKQAFTVFDLSHILAISAVAVTITALLINTPPKRREITLKLCAILVPFTELTHVIWMVCCGQTQIIKLLPLHICGMQVFFIPAAVFTGKTILKDYVYTTALLGGVLAILSPAGVAGAYPIFHFQTIQTLFLHMLLIFVALAMVCWTDYMPSVKRLPGILGIFTVAAAVTFVIDSSTGENYMFLRHPPDVPILVQIFNNFGQWAYLLLAFLLLLGAGIIIQLPFDIYKKKHALKIG